MLCLQTLLCPASAPFELSNSNRSCYLHQVTTRFVPKVQLQQTCQSLHPMAHLVAINTQQEHTAIKTFMQTAAPSCQYVWTSAETHVPGQDTDWFWDLGTTTQPMTYFDWQPRRPDNNGGTEKAILMSSAHNYAFEDDLDDLSNNAWYNSKTLCFICEIDIR